MSLPPSESCRWGKCLCRKLQGQGRLGSKREEIHVASLPPHPLRQDYVDATHIGLQISHMASAKPRHIGVVSLCSRRVRVAAGVSRSITLLSASQTAFTSVRQGGHLEDGGLVKAAKARGCFRNLSKRSCSTRVLLVWFTHGLWDSHAMLG